MSLKTNYKDFELAPEMGGKRRYKMINNDDGTVSFVDVSEYLEIGDAFKAEDINTTNKGVNELNQKLSNIGTFTERDFNVLDTAIWLAGGTYIITIQTIYTDATNLAVGLYNFSETNGIGMAEILNGSGRFSMTRLYKQEEAGGEQVGLHKYDGTGNISYTMTVLKVS